jgi:hypothetical protein
MVEKQELFRGHLEECLQDLASKLATVTRGSPVAAKIKRFISDFCGVTANSVTRWLHQPAAAPPIGGSLIKLMYFLDVTGYRVIELERIPKARKNFGELIGLGIISAKDSADLLGYSRASSLYQVLQGREGISKEKEQRMWTLWKERKDVLEQKRLSVLNAWGNLISELIPKNSNKTTKPTTSSLPNKTALVALMSGLLALFEETFPEKISEKDLSAELIQCSKTVLKLSAYLTALSSELLKSDIQKGGG